MVGLFHTLNIGSEALFATRQGVDTAGHNIANAQVEGYSRQRVNITQHEPLEANGILIGNGAYVGSITRAHDQFIENQLNKTYQDSGRADARAETLKSIEDIFSPNLNASVADELSKFFNSMQNLANFPSDYTVRTAVVESGRDAAASFRRVDNELTDSRAAVNNRVFELTGKITDQLHEVADLNIKIQVTEAGVGEVANDLRDQREKILRDLSGKIEIKYYEDQFGMLCVRGPDQVTLVDGGHSSVVSAVHNGDNDGLYDVNITDWEGHSTRDVTRKMDGGALDAYIKIRDEDIPHLRAKNNEMAYTFANEVNEVHRQGFGLGDYAESTGRNFFSPPVDVANAAAGMEVDDAILESNDAISAASSPQAPGDNINMNSLIKIKDKRLFPGERVTLNEFYADYTGALGLDTQRAGHVREANDILVRDLTQRREAVAGVSLDEEATNMMKWQANFTASSKVITTIDEMLDTVLSLKR